MTSAKYEEMIEEILKSAKVVDHTKNPCDESLIPENKVGIITNNRSS